MALTLFLVMALMTLRLWELAGVVVPLLVILAVQVALVAAICVWVVPRLMGRDYDAVVMAGGFCGFMLGTTANADGQHGRAGRAVRPGAEGLSRRAARRRVRHRLRQRPADHRDDQHLAVDGLSDALTTIGLPGRVAAPLAYAGWWITGALFWFLERRDLYVRFHAAQSCVVFGIVAVVVALLSGIAATSLLFMPERVRILGLGCGLDLAGGSRAVGCCDLARGNWPPVANSSCRVDCGPNVPAVI